MHNTMPPKQSAPPPRSGDLGKKRKEPPTSSSGSNKNPNAKSNRTFNPRASKRVKVLDARTILTQRSDKALVNGELDLQAFLKAREFEIKALEDGITRSKKALTTRAFQQVPKELRRRTASHNVKRVPKRLRSRAAKEMKDDNTPTVNAAKRKPGDSRSRLRAETAKRLGLLAGKKNLGKVESGHKHAGGDAAHGGIVTRAAKPKTKMGKLSEPGIVASRFRKRQIHKTWLPTHMWHAKRARMTEPGKPLWRFAVPLTPTEKKYRAMHRTGGARGACCWDTSYMSTIGLEGTEEVLAKMMRAVGLTEDNLWGKRGLRWREGKRSWEGWVKSRGEDGKVIGPATVIWCGPEDVSISRNVSTANAETPAELPNAKTVRRKLMVRIHPSAFLQLWEELLALSKLQRPSVRIQDLRFEIGSIALTGPGSTETLLGILHPANEGSQVADRHGATFKALAGVTNAASLPSNSLLAFSITDPRLHYPPRPVSIPKATNEAANDALLETLAAWPADSSAPSSLFFSQEARLKASHLPSQKSLNRRKALALPGAYPAIVATDPHIPIMLLTTRAPTSSGQGTWTLLAPWKCILPIWHGLMHYPLSSGGNPMFGGQQELRQICFERGMPWFPGDLVGTPAGWTWELEERERRKREWERRPRGKRTEYSSLDLGVGRKGEIGVGWACDFEALLPKEVSGDANASKIGIQKVHKQEDPPAPELEAPSTKFSHLSASDFKALLTSAPAKPLALYSTSLATVRITLLSRGVPQACARIYRLPTSTPPQPDPSTPSDPPTTTTTTTTTTQPPSAAKPLALPHDLRAQWLALLPTTTTKSNSKPNPKTTPTRRPTPHQPRAASPTTKRRTLAASLLATPALPYPAPPPTETSHPLVPDEHDLIGFVTTGAFNLAAGGGTAIASLSVARLLDAPPAPKQLRYCIVRNAGEAVGRLATWEVV